MIEVKHLRLIDTIARKGSLNKAAEAMHLTQSALSHQLKELESRLGVQVFYRRNNQLYFTPEGKELLDASSHLLEEFDHLEKRVKEIGQKQLNRYVHGYSEAEGQRLMDQAQTMSDLLHHDSRWTGAPKILEVGCGVGAQTKIIALKNPEAHFVSVDLSEKSLAQAREALRLLEIENVQLQQADVYQLPFESAAFDHVFVCFVLEHLEHPEHALAEMKRVLKAGGTLTVIEGDHGSTYFYPDSELARKAVQAQVDLQRSNGGDPNMGRRLFPLLMKMGLHQINVSPRQVYVDASKPAMVEGFIKQTFTAMIQGVREEAIAQKVISEEDMQRGIDDLLKTAADGTFCYTFFKAVGVK